MEMNNRHIDNPFSVTKAVDLTDQEIKDYWVDIGAEGRGFIDIVRPASPMPMLILGGKGSGKTHVMRYFSFSVQRIRNAQDNPAAVAQEGYLGIYLRCSGLNASRFRAKDVAADTWVDVFAYYLELSLCYILVSTIATVLGDRDDGEVLGRDLAQQIAGLLDANSLDEIASLSDLLSSLRAFQREVDVATNNCSVTRHLDLKINVSPGRLIFGVPALAQSIVPCLKHCQILYLLDELENLDASQQRYIQTLIREKEPPSSFKIGARKYGIRTYSTRSADEENKEGSEFERLVMDDLFRRRDYYDPFARAMIIRRLVECGIAPADREMEPKLQESLDQWFDAPAKSKWSQADTEFILRSYQGRERPYLKMLRQKLLRAVGNGGVVGLTDKKDVDGVLDELRVPDVPLLEKVNAFMLYRAWAARKDLRNAAKGIHEECEAFRQGVQGTSYKEVMLHFKSDMFAQLLRDCKQPQRYLGLKTLIEMTKGSPRCLLMILKNMYDWAVFNGERPFRGTPLSTRAQAAGLGKSVEWFYRDARVPGDQGRFVQAAVDRLGTLFRGIRFSDKPSECSCIAFSVDISKVTVKTFEILELAMQWSLILDVGAQRDRNTGQVNRSFQLNPMLSPRWDLPVARRGIIALQPDEVNTIFDPCRSEDFDDTKKRRLSRMNAPFSESEEVGDEPGLFS